MHKIQKDLLSLARNINLGERSLREIGALIGVDHPQIVSHHLKQLEKRGFLTVDRANRVVKNINTDIYKERRFINIPIVGAANCGPAEILAQDNIEGYIKLSKSMLKGDKNLFAVRAQGNSMNRANINGQNISEGDYVVVDKARNAPQHGDYVLSVIDGAANIKRFYNDKENGQIMLISESTENYPPICIHENDYSDILINGTIVQIVKQPKF